MKFIKILLIVILAAGSIIFVVRFNYKADEPQVLILTKSKFSALKNWHEDNQLQALLAFKNSCLEINKRPTDNQFSFIPESLKVKDWQTICNAAANLQPLNQANAKKFFEKWFEPYIVKTKHTKTGLFTGYYLPLLNASLEPTDRYRYPIYGVPNNLVKVDVSLFRPKYLNKPLVGYVNNNKLLPYPERAEISKGKIKSHAPIIAWGDNEIDIFFAQIQGSALLKLPDNSQIVIGYAGDNGRNYYPIGKLLIEQKQIEQKNISMQSIRNWLQNNSELVEDVLNHNPSYVFFQMLRQNNPVGSEKVPLTPMRSLAVDTHFIPLGVPLWLQTTIPVQNSNVPKPFHQLMIAQDTGGAIKGVVRGDIYCGAGDIAAFIAGNLKNEGSYWILLPKKNVSLVVEH